MNRFDLFAEASFVYGGSLTAWCMAAGLLIGLQRDRVLVTPGYSPLRTLAWLAFAGAALGSLGAVSGPIPNWVEHATGSEGFALLAAAFCLVVLWSLSAGLGVLAAKSAGGRLRPRRSLFGDYDYDQIEPTAQGMVRLGGAALAGWGITSVAYVVSASDLALFLALGWVPLILLADTAFSLTGRDPWAPYTQGEFDADVAALVQQWSEDEEPVMVPLPDDLEDESWADEWSEIVASGVRGKDWDWAPQEWEEWL